TLPDPTPQPPARADLAPARSAVTGSVLAVGLVGSAHGASLAGYEAAGSDASQPGLYPCQGAASQQSLAGVWEHSPALSCPGAPIAADARWRQDRGWHRYPALAGPPGGYPSDLAGLIASAIGQPGQVVADARAALRGMRASAAPAPEA